MMKSKVKSLKIKMQEEKIIKLKESILGLDKEKKTLEEITETYDKLGKKKHKTTEEQEEYKTMIETLQSEYPELITYYNEENNLLQLNVDLLKQKTEEMSKQLKEENRLLGLQNQRNINDIREKEQIVKMQNIDNKDTDTIYDALDGLNIDTDERVKDILTEDKIFNLSKKDIENAAQTKFEKSQFESLIGSEPYLIDRNLFSADKVTGILSNLSSKEGLGISDVAQKVFGNTSDLNSDEIISQIYDEIALQRDYTSGEITEGELKHYREAFGIAAQVVEEFSDEIQKYNSTLDAINNDLFSEKKYYLEQYSANKTITDSILGSGTAASDLAAGQAAFIQKSIFSDSSTEGDYEATIAALKSKGMDISGILSKSIIDGMIEDISEWHIKQDEWGDISKENKALLETIGIKKEEWDELGLEEMNRSEERR